MTFSDKLIALRKKAGWSQEELAERLNVSRQSVSKWESAQSMPDIDKFLQLSSLFSVTTDCLLKDTQDDTQPAAAQTPSPLPRVTLAQAEDYLTKAQANAPQMALATALCIVSPIPLLALGTVSELGLLGLDDNLAGGCWCWWLWPLCCLCSAARRCGNMSFWKRSPSRPSTA